MTTEGRYSSTDARALWFCTVCGAVVPVEARGVHDEWHDDLTPNGSPDDCDHGGGPATSCNWCAPSPAVSPQPAAELERIQDEMRRVGYSRLSDEDRAWVDAYRTRHPSVSPQPEPHPAELRMIPVDLDDDPMAICDRCGRHTWAPEQLGTLDRMTQPTGKPCGGTFVAAGPSLQGTGEEQR